MDMKTLLGRSNKKICTVMEGDKLQEVIAVLFDENVNAALVADNQEHLVGLLTEHDVVVAVNKYAEKIVELKAKDVMATDLIVCTPDTSLKEALSIMGENNIRHLPVVSSAGHLMGFVGLVEVMREFLTSIDAFDGMVLPD